MIIKLQIDEEVVTDDQTNDHPRSKPEETQQETQETHLQSSFIRHKPSNPIYKKQNKEKQDPKKSRPKNPRKQSGKRGWKQTVRTDYWEVERRGTRESLVGMLVGSLGVRWGEWNAKCGGFLQGFRAEVKEGNGNRIRSVRDSQTRAAFLRLLQGTLFCPDSPRIWLFYPCIILYIFTSHISSYTCINFCAFCLW